MVGGGRGAFIGAVHRMAAGIDGQIELVCGALYAENLAETITGLRITELSADVSTFVENRLLDDDANVLLRFNNGAKGVLHCSQICAGEENPVNIRIYGEKGSTQWHQHDPNTMYVKWLERPMEVYRTGTKLYGRSSCSSYKSTCRSS